MRTRNAIDASRRGRPAGAAARLRRRGPDPAADPRVAAPDRPYGAAADAIALVLVGAVLVAAVVAVAALPFGHGASVGGTQRRQPHVALTGAQIEIAGFHFRTPAGFKKEADTSCAEPVTSRQSRHGRLHGGGVGGWRLRRGGR